ncbi:putative Acyl-protein thioesterase 1 [Glarea lozoyensis 74030]|uniref:Acyl-protein thioesterase 1 n=1 Tax=Glarea lozoyensis (strain ATCC 74030 / MF5533) TaxID=1104152 RepID=H0EJJ3_GLAL7|nr:putative Acyl-protein thioesterase 1 [Glarea lozoyensis 74030]
MNAFKTGAWTVAFVASMISVSRNDPKLHGAATIAADVVVLIAFWIPFIYGIFVFVRNRKAKRSYASVDKPLLAQETSYPPQYKNLTSEGSFVPVEQPPPARERRASYNHTRDTRFETFREQRRKKSATFIFLHGLGDDAGGWVNIAQQFQSAQKLPYLNWIFPNACFNQEASTNAWYTPTAFSPIPVGRSSSGNASDSEHREDHNEATQLEILESAEYICTLVDQEIENGIDVERIVIGGFSQGCAVALITGLGSRYAGKIGGIVGLSGYLPDGKVIENAMKSTEGDGKMKLFLAHGARDMLVPDSRNPFCWTRMTRIRPVLH